MTEPTVLVAHRGHAAEWPENTLPALESAAAAGASWVEIDVQLSADGVPLLLHDTDLERVAGTARNVLELEATALAEIPVGEPGRFGERFKDARVPTLAAFATWLHGRPGLRAFVELKIESLEHYGRERVLAACRAALAPANGQWAFISYDYEVLGLASATGSEALGWVVRGFDEDIAQRARRLPTRWLFCRHDRLPAGPLPAGPWQWAVYEVAEETMARDLIARGAHWLETMDYPALAAALAREPV